MQMIAEKVISASRLLVNPLQSHYGAPLTCFLLVHPKVFCALGLMRDYTLILSA